MSSDIKRLRRSLYLKQEHNYICEVCMEEYPEEVLEFHHPDPNEKELGLKASNWTKKNLKNVLDEADKCNVLCSNCHRLEHVAIKKGESILNDEETYLRYRNHRFTDTEGFKSLDGRDVGFGDTNNKQLLLPLEPPED